VSGCAEDPVTALPACIRRLCVSAGAGGRQAAQGCAYGRQRARAGGTRNCISPAPATHPPHSWPWPAHGPLPCTTPSPLQPLSSYYLDGAVCRRCPQGHVRGASDAACKICLPGTFSDMEMHECRPCARGNYAHWHAMTRCLWCKPGSYADAPGATECKPCAAGTSSGYQAAKCA
jgi:hypothetical protein